MALTETLIGSLYPGSNAKSVIKYGMANDTLYTVPTGRILYVTDSEKILLNNTSMPVQYEGGLTTDDSRRAFWATQGDVITASTNGAKIIGIEFDA